MNNRSEWFLSKLCLLITISLVLIIGILTTTSSPSFAAPTQNEISIPSQGYIITLHNDPISVYQNSLKKENSIDRETKLTAYTKRLEEEHADAKKDWETLMAVKDKILGEYSYGVNAIALNITSQEAEKLKKQSSFVKDIYKNMPLTTSLFQSVPMIYADKVWDTKDANNNPVIGKDVTIAILDTGIDYTHPDLGKTVITERPLEKITTKPLEPVYLQREQVFGYSDDIIAYPVGNQIALYSRATKTTTMTDLSDNQLTSIEKIALYHKNLVYFARNAYYSGIYIYNLDTKKTKKIAETAVFFNFSFSNNTLVYGRSFTKDINTYSIYLYDIAHGKETRIGKEMKDIPDPLISDNIVAYTPWDNGGCHSKLNLYNIQTKETKVVTPPHIGTLLDFSGKKLLYDASLCNYTYPLQIYSLYDIATGQVEEMQTDPRTIAPTNVTIIASHILHGSIQNAFAYVSKPLTKALSIQRIWAYDREKKEGKQLTAGKNSYFFIAQGNNVCFLSDDYHIYCHTYDRRGDYSLPTKLFNDKVVGGYDFVNGDNDPIDDNGHGTHVADIAGGNGIPQGVAPGTKLLAYKVLDEEGRGNMATALQAIDMAVQTRTDSDTTNDVDIMNLSFGANCKGTYTKDCGPDDILSQAVDNSVRSGIVSVVAAGNTGPNPETINSPGTSRLAITVGAVGKAYKIPDFSSHGPVTYNGETIDKPDLVAPGVDICASEWSGYFYSNRCSDDIHVALSGTSMAAPHVSGGAAFLLQLHPEFSPQDIKTAITKTTQDLMYDTYKQGAGLLNTLDMIHFDQTHKQE